MGLLNVIKIANDYNKAKKLIEQNQEKLEEAKTTITSLVAVVNTLKGIVERINTHIKDVENVIKQLKGGK